MDSKTFWLIVLGTGCAIAMTAVITQQTVRKKKRRSRFDQYMEPPVERPHNIKPNEISREHVVPNGAFSPTIKVDLSVVNAIIDNLLAPSPAADFTQKTPILPPFPEQIEHLVNSFKSSMRKHSMLLIEGGPGIGKGTALQYWVAEENGTRPAVYFPLSQTLKTSLGSSSFGDLTILTNSGTSDQEVSRDAFRTALETSLGYEAALSTLKDTPRSSFAHISLALKAIRPKIPKPPLLVIDDVQLLFLRKETNQLFDDIPECFEFLMACQQEDMVDVVLCCSEKSVFSALKSFGYAFEKNLVFCPVESVQDELIIKYLLTRVNDIIGSDTQGSAKLRNRRFNLKSARLFVETFNGNLLELERFCESDLSLEDFIYHRRELLIHLLQKYAADIPAEYDLKAVVLDMILKNGSLPVHQLTRSQLSVVEMLLEGNFVRWKVSKDDHPDFESSAFRQHIFARFGHEGAQICWYSGMMGQVFEAWFNETI